MVACVGRPYLGRIGGHVIVIIGAVRIRVPRVAARTDVMRKETLVTVLAEALLLNPAASWPRLRGLRLFVGGCRSLCVRGDFSMPRRSRRWGRDNTCSQTLLPSLLRHRVHMLPSMEDDVVGHQPCSERLRHRELMYIWREDSRLDHLSHHYLHKDQQQGNHCAIMPR